MKLKILVLCVTVLLGGCIQYSPPATPENPTETPSAKDRLDQSATTPSQPSTPSAKYEVNAEAIEMKIHEEINDRRRSNNVSELQHSTRLGSIARYKSWHMAKHDYFAHENVPGISHSIFRDNYNSRCDAYGQNLHKRIYNKNLVNIQYRLKKEKQIANSAVNGLMNSTGHRENILDPAYDVQGIGVFVDENGTVFVTQEFCGYR